MKGDYRFTVELSKEQLAVVRELAALDKITMTEVVRRAIRLNQFLVQARIAGEQVLLRDKQGRVREVMVW